MSKAGLSSASAYMPIESCKNLEIVVHALKKVRDLLLLMAKATDRQLEILSDAG